MTNILSLLQNGEAITHGAWIKPAGFGDLEIRTRGVTDEYVDFQNKTIGEARQAAGGILTTTAARNLEINAWVQCCFLDVRGLTHGDPTEADPTPKPVTADEFVGYLRTVDGQPLWMACRAATAAVAASKVAQEAAITGN